MPHTDPATLMRRATIASASVAIVLIALKFYAYWASDSVSLLSSLVDSFLDSMASIVNFFAVRHALAPADDEHRFGHGKAEPLAGLGQAAFITGSSLFLIIESVRRLSHPSSVENSELGIAVMVISLLLTIALVLYQRYVIAHTQSLAIQADSLHYLSDISLNIGVIIALVLTSYWSWQLADPVIALLIAVYIVFSAWQIFAQSIDQLMDKELPEEERAKIIELLMSHPEARGFHELRTRVSGMQTFIQLHLELDGHLSLSRAHAIGDEVAEIIEAQFPGADIIIHQDPQSEL
ncbi:MAG: cation diffusion facilitator family transporter [Cellvibrionaceae bacterium]|nr:cation diffusion facilitator family transporter [Cellvibrionaceae bacterium]